MLWKTSMPAVLVELGFISNSTDLEALKNSSERDKLAARLCKAFKKYKTKYDGSVALDVEVEAPAAKPADKPAEKPEVKQEVKPAEKPAEKAKSEAAASGVRYGVQIFAGSRKIDPKDKSFLGQTPVVIDTGKLFKYIIGVDPSIEKARENLTRIREKYPDAFLVKIDGETAVRAK